MGITVKESTKVRQYIVGLAAVPSNGEKLQRIPTEEKLCQLFKISRPTLRKTLQCLVDEGFLVRKPHWGTFINNEQRSRVNFYTECHRVIGVVVGDGRLTFLTPYYLTLLAKLFEILAVNFCHGRMLVLDGSPERELSMLLDSRQLDGLILITPSETVRNSVQVLQRFDIPLVAAMENPDDCFKHYVYTDVYDGHYLMAEHFLHHGHRHILFLNDNNEDPIRLTRKKAGSQAAFMAAGVDWNEKLWQCASSDHAEDTIEDICHYCSDFTVAVVSEAFYGLLRRRLSAHPIPVIHVAGVFDPRESGFQIVSAPAGMGIAAGGMMIKLLNAPDSNPKSHRVKVNFEVRNEQEYKSDSVMKIKDEATVS